MAASPAPPTCQAWDPRPQPPRETPPAEACDCHAHVFGPVARYPLAAGSRYTPPEAPLAAYLAMLDALGVARGVLVQPSVYGTDNRAMLDALADAARDAPGRLRAVAVVDPQVADAELDRLHAAGVRGVRLNLLQGGGPGLAAADRLAPRLAERGWHLQLLVDVSDFAPGLAALDRLPVTLVLDHMGHMSAARGLDHPGFRELLALLRDGALWVKLSAAYRLTARDRAPYDDVVPFARALIAANPARVVWATDWPHPMVDIAMPNDGALLDALADWAPEPELRRRILVDNPAALYGF